MKRKKIVKMEPGKIVNIDKETEVVGVSLGQLPLPGSKFPSEHKETRFTVEVEYQPEEPKAREFEARPCSSCQAIRPHGKNYSRVYCTRGNIRYCKCHFCNHTWAQEGK